MHRRARAAHLRTDVAPACALPTAARRETAGLQSSAPGRMVAAAHRSALAAAALLLAAVAACLLLACGAGRAWADDVAYEDTWLATNDDGELAYVDTAFYDDALVDGSLPEGATLQISEPGELAYVAYLVNSGTTFSGATIQLAGDIDLQGHWWTAIGYSTTRHFDGTFDGNGHAIKNMAVSSSSGNATSASYCVGLFGSVNGAVIENLTLDASCSVSMSVAATSPRYVGGVVGYAAGGTTIRNCTNAAYVASGYSSSTAAYAGGIVGYLTNGANEAYIESCINTGTITTNCTTYYPDLGGIIGYGTATGTTVTNCKNAGSVNPNDSARTYSQNASRYIGGIAGYLATIPVEECSNYGKVDGASISTWTTTSTYVTYGVVGGIVGQIYNAGVSDCENWGNVSGPNKNGGIAGYAYGTAAKPSAVTSCRNYGQVSSNTTVAVSSSSYGISVSGGIAGLAGAYGTFTDCVNYGSIYSGKVTVDESGQTVVEGTGTWTIAGGIVGYSNAATASVSSCANYGSIVGVAGTNATYFGGCAGGITGFDNLATTITNSYNAGEVSLTGDGGCGYAGGITGYSKAADTISGCCNEGQVTARGSVGAYAGGIAGYSIYTAAAKMTNSYNVGAVNAIEGAYAGGIAGRTSSVTTLADAVSYAFAPSVYNAGAVSCVAADADMQNGSAAGSLVGYVSKNSTTSTAIYCNYSQAYYLSVKDQSAVGASDLGINYYDPDTGEASDVACANACTSDELAALASVLDPAYGTWLVNGTSGGTYPILSWQAPSILEYRNASDAFSVIRVGIDEETSLGADKIAAIYAANDHAWEPTDDGTVPAGYELSSLSWSGSPTSSEDPSVEKGEGAAEGSPAVPGIYDDGAQRTVCVYASGVYGEDGSLNVRPITYSITYQGIDEDCQNDNRASYTVEDSFALVAPVPSESDGKAFGGWLLEDGTVVTSVSAGTTGNMVLTASWVDAAATVTARYVDPDGVERSVVLPGDAAVSIDGELVESPDFESAFKPADDEQPELGYATVGYAATVQTKDGQTTLALATTSGSLIAYRLNTELDGGSFAGSEAPASFTVADDAIYIPNPTIASRTFVGWFTDESLENEIEGAPSAANADALTYQTKDLAQAATQSADDGSWSVTLYAQWSVCAITFDLGTTLATPGEGWPTAIEMDGSIDLSALDEPTRNGYTFAGWVDEDGNPIEEVSYQVGGVTVYAVWDVAPYTLTLSSGVSDDDPYQATVTYPSSLHFDEETGDYTYQADDAVQHNLVPATRPGYTFLGWFKEGTNTRVYTIYPGGYFHENLTLVARWEVADYALAWDANGGAFADGVQPPASFSISSGAIDTAAYVPVRDDYEFDGWYTDAYLTKLAGVIAGETWDASSAWQDTVLYAKWVPVSYAISYELDGGANSDANPGSYTVEDGVIPLASATRDGATFGGWYLDADFTMSVAELDTAQLSGDITLYAKWNEPTGGSGAEGSVDVSAGNVTVSVQGFSDAEIVEVSAQDGSYTTAAVVTEGSISFWAPQAGSYDVSQMSYPLLYNGDGYDGMDVWYNATHMLTTTNYLTTLPTTAGRANMIPRILSSDAIGGLSLSNGGLGTVAFVPYKGVSTTDYTQVSFGSASDPITGLVHFIGEGEDASGSISMEKQTADGLLGYQTSSANAVDAAASAATGASVASHETDHAPSYLLVEDRDENTGRLVGSVLFTPDADVSPTGTGQGGSQAFNLVVSPSSELMAQRFAQNSVYAGDADAAAADASAIAQAEDASSSMVVIANLDTMSAYDTGEKVYTLDIATLSGGKIKAGDQVVLRYVGGSGDASSYTPSVLYSQKTEATRAASVVDGDGYVTFSLYGGGVYALTASADESDAIALAASLTTAASASADDPASDPETSEIDIPVVLGMNYNDALPYLSDFTVSVDGPTTGDAIVIKQTTGTAEAGSTIYLTTFSFSSLLDLADDGDGDGSDDDNATATSTSQPVATATTAATTPTVGTSTTTASVAVPDTATSDDLAEVDEATLGDVDLLSDEDAEALQEQLDELSGGDSAWYSFLQDDDGNWVWWRVLLLILAVLVVLGLVGLLVRWLLMRRRKAAEQGGDGPDGGTPAGKATDGAGAAEAAAAVASGTGSAAGADAAAGLNGASAGVSAGAGAAGGASSAADTGRLTAEQATAAAVAAAAEAARAAERGNAK